MKLIFYTTSGCHLCDRALEIIHVCLDERNYPIEAIDIASSDLLIEQYGTCIPLLQREDTGGQLLWPFSAGDLMKFVDIPYQD